MNLQRTIKTIVGRRNKYQSHNLREFPKYSRGVNVNNLVTVSTVNDYLPIKTVITSNRRKEEGGGQCGVNKKNLTSVNIVQAIQNSEMCFCVLNAQSCKNKASEVSDFIMDNQIDVLAMTETWLAPGDRDRCIRSEVTPPGYDLLDVPRSKGRGGGVALILKNSVHVKKQKISVVTTSYECMEVLLNASSCFIRVLIVYRPPSTGKSGSPSSVFFEEFTKHLDELCTASGQLLIIGDFNFHYDDSASHDVLMLKDVMETFSLKQHVVGATHKKGHILDLVMTREEELDIRSILNHGPIISDHSAISFTVPIRKPQTVKKTFRFRNLKAIDPEQFHNDIKSSDLVCNPAETLDEAVSQYNSILSGLLDKHAPEVVKPLRTHPSSPWFTAEIKAQKTVYRQAERRWRKHPLTVNFQIYQDAYTEYRVMCTEAKKSFFQQKVQECADNQKALYSMASRLMFKGKSTALPSHTDSQEMAQSFAQFFDDKIDKIRNEIRANQDSSPAHEVTVKPPEMNTLALVTEQELREIVCQSNSKHCSLDPIPTSLVKSCLNTLLPVICRIINLSLQASRVPDVFKHAIVTPLIKKPSLDKENFKNYRPVSNLSYISKILEKVVMARINNHFDTNCLREVHQSAYRAGHSTETALVKVFNDMLCSVDNRQYVLLVLLDLSAAFDTIDHEVMIARLESLFGVQGQALEWLKSYFSGRTQRIIINSCSSSPVQLSTGIPQGSVAGPGTFPAYTQPIGTLAHHHDISLHLYADDTQLYVGCRLQDHEACKERLEACIAEVRQWMAKNMLKLNDDKTEYVVVGSRHMLRHLPEPLRRIRVGNKTVPATSSARNIGVMVDSALTMEQQVTHICRVCYISLREIGKIRQYLTDDVTKKLVIAFVMSKLDSNNALLYKIAKYLIEKLQLVQNNAARLIAKKSKHTSIEHTRKELHWLPIEFRINYKINLLTFKCLNNIAPLYLQNLLHFYKPKRDLRSSDKGYLDGKKTRTVAGDRAFCNAAPKLWNELPEDIRNIKRIECFKTALKTHLFEIAFNIKK